MVGYQQLALGPSKFARQQAGPGSCSTRPRDHISKGLCVKLKESRNTTRMQPTRCPSGDALATNDLGRGQAPTFRCGTGHTCWAAQSVLLCIMRLR